MKKLRKGLTLIEILVVIALIAIISSVVVINNKRSDKFKVQSTADKLLSDIKRVRNMAVSRTTVNIEGESVFPPGGYGIEKDDAYGYYIYAYPNADDIEDPIELSYITLQDNIKISDNNDNSTIFHFRFKSEKQFNTDLEADAESGHYEIKVHELICGYVCEASVIHLGEQTEQGFWSNIGSHYTETIPITSCFLKGTKILLSDYSYKNIEDIQVGDIVMGYNNGKYTKSKVLELESPLRQGYYILSLSDGKELKLTNEHPIYTRNSLTKGWASLDPDATYLDSKMKVFKLKNLDEVFTIDGWKRINNIEYIKKEVQTYNLKSVEGNTFFAEGVLVHNKEKPSSLGL